MKPNDAFAKVDDEAPADGTIHYIEQLTDKEIKPKFNAEFERKIREARSRDVTHAQD